MNLSKRFSVCGGALVVAVVATSVQAAPPFNVLKFDINNVKATLSSALAAGGTSVGIYNGTITFAMATTVGITTDFALVGGGIEGNNSGSPFPGNPFFGAGAPGTLTSIGGTLTFASGVVTGLSFSFGNGSESFSTGIVPFSGVLDWDSTAMTYEVSGFTSGGIFSPSPFVSPPVLFGAVDISLFAANQLAGGSAGGIFFDFFIPPSVTVTEAVQAELIIAIPLPQSVAMASVCLLGLGIRRRRL